jgi:hypothetical protein
MNCGKRREVAVPASVKCSDEVMALDAPSPSVLGVAQAVPANRASA